jgi:3-oxoacyl-[acyl-carrier-protein] synthase III
MRCVFKHKAITALLSVVPRQEYCFDDEYPNYKLDERKAKRLKKMMGLDRHRIAPAEVCSSDLCLYGLNQLLDDGVLTKQEIGALLFVSQTPDYFLPPTSSVLHGKLGLGHDVICMDINQGCAGFVVGLMQAFLLLELPEIQKVVLLNADTASKQISRSNRVSYPLAGDAGAVTVIERSSSENPIYMQIKMDGSRHQALMIPGGAYRMPSSPETLRLREVEEGVERSLEHIHMDGAAIFNFTMEDVPKQIEEILAFSGRSKDSIEHFFFHQPNQFILKQMAAKMGIPPSKLPNNIVGIYGNPSSVSIPLVAAHNCGDMLLRETCSVCLSGFGVGLTWGSVVMDLGPLLACRVVDYAQARGKADE